MTTVIGSTTTEIPPRVERGVDLAVIGRRSVVTPPGVVKCDAPNRMISPPRTPFLCLRPTAALHSAAMFRAAATAITVIDVIAAARKRVR
jgi:hypothetical protein